MTLERPEHFTKMTKMTENGLCYLRYNKHLMFFFLNWYETAQEHLPFKVPPVSLKQIEKFLRSSFKTVENFSNSKPRPPGQRTLGENPTPRAAGMCKSPGVARGDGQAWN